MMASAFFIASSSFGSIIRFPHPNDIVFFAPSSSFSLPLIIALPAPLRRACGAECEVCVAVAPTETSPLEACFAASFDAQDAEDEVATTLDVSGLGATGGAHAARVLVRRRSTGEVLASARSAFAVGHARPGLRNGETLVHRGCHVFCRVAESWAERRPLRSPCAGIASARGERPRSHATDHRCRALYPRDDRSTLGIAWQVGGPFGWAILGESLALHLIELGVNPLPVSADNALTDLRPARAAALAPHVARGRALLTDAAASSANLKLLLPFPIVFSLGESLRQVARADEFGRFFSSTSGGNIGLAFLEDATLDPKLAPLYDGPLFVGSAWNADVVHAATGRTDVHIFLQGVDPALFHLARRRRERHLLPFAVFSGGKLELRKGQDIAVAAFRLFSSRVRARDPAARLELVTSWHHAWTELMDIELAPHATSRPRTSANGSLLLGEWLETHGVPRSDWRNVPVTPHDAMAAVLHSADVALFPNRCEGGLNLVAVEALACGIPTILSRNTGHRDLIDTVEGERGCYPLAAQRAVAMEGDEMHVRVGWGESDVSEVADALEAVYRDGEEARRRAFFASQRIRSQLTWLTCTSSFVEVLRSRGLIAPRRAATAAAAAAATAAAEARRTL